MCLSCIMLLLYVYVCERQEKWPELTWICNLEGKRREKRTGRRETLLTHSEWEWETVSFSLFYSKQTSHNCFTHKTDKIFVVIVVMVVVVVFHLSHSHSLRLCNRLLSSFPPLCLRSHLLLQFISVCLSFFPGMSISISAYWREKDIHFRSRKVAQSLMIFFWYLYTMYG